MSDKIADHARRWLNGPLPADLMADLADIVEDDEYDAEKRAHQVVWQALKWMIDHPVGQGESPRRQRQDEGDE